MTEPFEIVYCPHHLNLHMSGWCTAGDHEGLGTEDGPTALAEARRRGRSFFSDDVVNPRDSADDPCVGDVVGDSRAVRVPCTGGSLAESGNRLFDRGRLREITGVDDENVTWKRPQGGLTFVCSRKTWKSWARGAWRCDPSTGLSTRSRFWE